MHLFIKIESYSKDSTLMYNYICNGKLYCNLYIEMNLAGIHHPSNPSTHQRHTLPNHITHHPDPRSHRNQWRQEPVRVLGREGRRRHNIQGKIERGGGGCVCVCLGFWVSVVYDWWCICGAGAPVRMYVVRQGVPLQPRPDQALPTRKVREGARLLLPLCCCKSVLMRLCVSVYDLDLASPSSAERTVEWGRNEGGWRAQQEESQIMKK
jgi:hypothetical protein